MSDNKSLAFEHAWKYFEIHTQQRMTVFNFYIAIIGLLAAGSGVCLQQGGKYVYFASAMGVFIIFMSFIFFKLDERVSSLIKNSEAALIKLEKGFDEFSYVIFHKESSDSSVNTSLFSVWTYGRCFRVSFFVVANVGFILALSPLFTVFLMQ
ncbi:hypothetical protein EO763_07725 [Pectobacterium odoriferum]|uniref:hypothetical protein n=1 Tax=Pectobacterium odoriferum TaxID=78398 RepID=UPI0013741BE1|nr:hypothetical protein [Pectobacterium odoriferum]QHP79828.1 hypothetical protein EO763_07725 [Pectobacterium odoriferum]